MDLHLNKKASQFKDNVSFGAQNKNIISHLAEKLNETESLNFLPFFSWPRLVFVIHTADSLINYSASFMSHCQGHGGRVLKFTSRRFSVYAIYIF